MTAGDLLGLLRERGKTLAVAESLTGGMLADSIIAVPGASAVFVGGIVSYATRLKSGLLGVDAPLLAEHGPIHPDVARQMAEGARRACGADVGIGTTGVAGPDAQDGHEPGEVYVAVAVAGGTRVRSLALSGSREDVRAATVREALDLALRTLESAEIESE